MDGKHVHENVISLLKTTMEYHNPLIKMTTILKKELTVPSPVKNAEQLEVLCMMVGLKNDTATLGTCSCSLKS